MAKKNQNKQSKGKQFLYILTNISMPGICKVGITDDIEQRIKSLSKTNVPTRFQLYEKFEVAYPEILEQKILQHFAEKRINRKREFLQVHPERICDFINDNRKVKPENDEKLKGKLAKLGIKKGEILQFKEGDGIYPDIIAKVVDPNSKWPIKFKGDTLSLSEAAKRVLHTKRFDKKWKAVQGTIFWAYKGKTIRELLDDKGIK